MSSIANRLRRVFGGEGKNKTSYATMRPTSLEYWTRGSSDVAKLPSVPFLGYRFVSEVYQYSDLLKTIIRSLVQETFRKGLTVVHRFVVKCNICGTEYQTEVKSCDVCGGDSLRKPNEYEGRWLKKWVDDVNFNDQNLLDVLQDIDYDLNIFDNAYLAVVKKYAFDVDGNVIGAEVVEVLRANPEFVMLVMDSSGRPARTDDGRVVVFCLEHRDKYEVVDPGKVEEVRCSICGKKLYPSYFQMRKWKDGRLLNYTNGEILHLKKFTHGLGYGLSPIFSVWMKILTLMKQDWFILTAYHLERPPKALLILRGNPEEIEKSWRKLMEEAKTNPHIIFPLVVSGADNTTRISEFVDLSFTAKDIDFIAYRDEIRRTVGAMYGVMPIFQGDTRAGIGIANEGLQVVVTNRAVEREQTLFNEKVLPWLIKQMGVMDWEIKLLPNEGRDMVARIQRETMRIGNAERMLRLGYKPVAVKTDDGIDFDYEVMETGQELPEGSGGYISNRVNQEVSMREAGAFTGEPEHSKPMRDEQRFEGEDTGVRRERSDAGSSRVLGVIGEGGELEPVEESLDIKKEDFEVFTSVLDDVDYEILKVGWSQAVKGRFGSLRDWLFSTLSHDWMGYEGLTKTQSDAVNDVIASMVEDGVVNVNKIIEAVVDEVGIPEEKAELIVKTELANLANRVREEIYRSRTNVKKFVFKTMGDEAVCEKCSLVESMTANGVSLDDIKKIIKEVGGQYARDYTVHPLCRCAIAAKHGGRFSWE